MCCNIFVYIDQVTQSVSCVHTGPRKKLKIVSSEKKTSAFHTIELGGGEGNKRKKLVVTYWFQNITGYE